MNFYGDIILRKILIVFISILPSILFSQEIKVDTTSSVRNIYNENTFYLSSNFWSGLELIKNGETIKFDEFSSKYISKYPDALSDFKIYETNKKYSVISTILASAFIGLTFGVSKNNDKQLVPIFGVSSLGFIIAGGYFQNKSFDALHRSIWKYNRYAILKE